MHSIVNRGDNADERSFLSFGIDNNSVIRKSVRKRAALALEHAGLIQGMDQQITNQRFPLLATNETVATLQLSIDYTDR